MTLSRAGKRADESDEWVDLQQGGSDIPPAAKDCKRLVIPGEEQQLKKGKSSFHTVLLAFKNSAKAYKPLQYYKVSEKDHAHVAEFEAVCADFMRLYSLDVATNTRAYYENGQLNGVASKEHQNFKCNKDDPLRLEDLQLANIDLLGSEEAREHFQRSLESLAEALNREPDSQTGYLTYAYKLVGNTINRFKSSTTAVSLESKIKDFLAGNTRLDKKSVEALFVDLRSRKDWVQKQIKHGHQGYQKEAVNLENVITEGTQLLESESIISPQFIEHMEALDKVYPQNLNRFEDGYAVKSYQGQYEHSHPVGITIQDLKNYRTVKGISIALALSYLFMEGDCHNRNISKNGQRIDYDMMFWWMISFHWKDQGMIDILGRSPLKSPYQITARDILNFPDIEDAKFFYWPTKQTIFSLGSKSIPDDMKNYISELQIYMTNNFYATNDNLVFKKLKKHPVFNFFKYKVFSQFAVMPVDIYSSLIDLNMSPNTSFFNKIEKEKQSLPNAMRAAVRKQRLDLRKVLLNMPEFQDFYSQYKALIIKMNIEELTAYKNKYQCKPDSEKYKGLIDSIDLDAYKENLQSLLKESQAKLMISASRLFSHVGDIVEDYSGSEVDIPEVSVSKPL